jgi:hypothetical protein
VEAGPAEPSADGEGRPAPAGGDVARIVAGSAIEDVPVYSVPDDAGRPDPDPGIAPVIIGRPVTEGSGRPLDIGRVMSGEYAAGDLFATESGTGAPGRRPAPEINGDDPAYGAPPPAVDRGARGNTVAAFVEDGGNRGAGDSGSAAGAGSRAATAPAPAGRAGAGNVRPGLGDAAIAAFLSGLGPNGQVPACGGATGAAGMDDASSIDLVPLTRRLIEAWRDGRLTSASKDAEGYGDIAGAIARIGRFRAGAADAASSAGMAARGGEPDPFAAIGRCPARRLSCWSGSRLDTANLAAALFWLDLLSLTDRVWLSEFHPHNQAVILEAGLNPKRATACAIGSASDAPAAFSLYIADSVENPGIVHTVAGRIGRFPLAISGANLVGNRFIQTSAGDKLREGAAPSVDSRLVHIGELGTYFKTRDGLAVSIYDPRMTWHFGG